MTDAEQTPLIERYQRLLELSLDLASTLELKTLLNRIVHAAADLCHAEAASILLYDENKEELYFEAASNLDTPLMRGLVVPVESSIAGWILREKQAVMIDDVQKDPRHFGQIADTTKIQTHSLLGVPLFAKDKVIGVLEAINKLSGRFSEDDQGLLMALGAQAAVAIENARLFQQSDLISDLVHELRTPLTSLNAITHLILLPDMEDEKRYQYIRTMQGEIMRLADMASAFLDLARLESGRSTFHIEPADIPNLLKECASVMRLKISDKEQTFNVAIQEDIPLCHLDRDKIKQVTLNLLNNASNYTPAGGEITLTAASSPDEVIIRIQDTGRGISPESLPFIYDKFYRVPGSERSSQGTGLGLSICKQIIEAHRGRIEVESRPGSGSTFSVHLPLSDS